VPAATLGGVMSRKSLVLHILSASFWVVSPAFGQNFNLPDGPGKETVVAVCGGCHAMNRLGAGYTPEGMVVRMMLNFDVPIPEDQLASVTEYLAKAFPERPRPAAVINPGPVEVSIKEWPVATLGSRPHDPLAAKDGAIWYTGQLANVLGRLDPKTGQIKEYKLRTSQTAPHGLVEDRDGNIWFTGNFRGLIGKLDPKTGGVTEWHRQLVRSG
jgi:virginiamycin B lyase